MCNRQNMLNNIGSLLLIEYVSIVFGIVPRGLRDSITESGSSSMR